MTTHPLLGEPARAALRRDRPAAPEWVFDFIRERTPDDIRARMFELAGMWRDLPGRPEELRVMEEWLALSWQLGGFLCPPHEDAEAMLPPEWLLRPYHDPEPDRTETRA